MPYEFKERRRVQFADTDAAGVMHFTVFFRFMEETEHAFYEQIGHAGYRRSREGVEGMPRVTASCEFRRPLRYYDTVEIHLRVKELTTKTVTYDFVFRKVGEEADVVATGAMRVIHAARRHGEDKLSALDMPPEVLAQIEVAPPSP